MIIASQKRKENIAEYLIYMWQIEDIIRANNLDIEKIKENVIDRFNLVDNQQREMIEWYESLIDMMRREDVAKNGHLQINKNVIQNLAELHGLLLASTKYPFYNAAYFKALPFIVELRQRGDQTISEIEVCFEALYGVLLLRLQQKEISKDTAKAIEVISNFLSLLANYYEKDKKGELDFE